jgi:hypothetical protein
LSFTVSIVDDVHVEPTQMYAASLQSALDVQLVLHAPVPHTYGAHDFEAGVLQVPIPSQAAAGVNVLPVQVAARQVVPAA